MREQIWVGDVVRALAAVRPADEEQTREVVRLLGLDLPARGSPRDPRPPPPDLTSTGAAAGTPRQGEAALLAEEAPDASSSGADELPLLTPVAVDPPPRTGWGPLTLPAVESQHLTAVPPYEPLLAPRSTAAVLQASLSAEVQDGPVDVPALVELVARRERPEPIPRERRRTLRYGVQVLVDLGTGMQPFARDAAELVGQVRRVVGVASTSVRWFAHCPTRGAGPGPGWTWRAYDPPDPGTRVLIASDLGMLGPVYDAQRSWPDEWAELGDRLRRAGCRPVALVPCPQERWPRELRTLLPMLVWDRGTTVGRVLAALDHR